MQLDYLFETAFVMLYIGHRRMSCSQHWILRSLARRPRPRRAGKEVRL